MSEQTRVVSARVPAETALAVERALRRRGMTRSDLVSAVWDYVARTGKVPVPVADEDEREDQLAELRRLRSASLSRFGHDGGGDLD